MKNDAKRLSVSLTGRASEDLEYLTTEQDITSKEAICRAIRTEAYFFNETLAGSRILLQKPGEDTREIVLR